MPLKYSLDQRACASTTTTPTRPPAHRAGGQPCGSRGPGHGQHHGGEEDGQGEQGGQAALARPARRLGTPCLHKVCVQKIGLQLDGLEVAMWGVHAGRACNFYGHGQAGVPSCGILPAHTGAFPLTQLTQALLGVGF